MANIEDQYEWRMLLVGHCDWTEWRVLPDPRAPVPADAEYVQVRFLDWRAGMWVESKAVKFQQAEAA